MEDPKLIAALVGCALTFIFTVAVNKYEKLEYAKLQKLNKLEIKD